MMGLCNANVEEDQGFLVMQQQCRAISIALNITYTYSRHVLLGNSEFRGRVVERILVVPVVPTLSDG